MKDESMESTLICPKCDTEYLSHITLCADCQVELVEDSTDGAEIKFSNDNAVVIAKGAFDSLKSLIALLEEERIPHSLNHLDYEPNTQLSPVSEFGLLVQQEDSEKVIKIVEERVHSEFPELVNAQTQLDSGQCPACGAEVGDATICPECELPLIIEES
ncbi:MAG: hypothetical protein ISR90_06955 [Candidatus Marinimicrobia bacterium]|nr:hypothetical protein [Candidatus Neomarinimicrobiota bacterium]MBL7023770.1 hypothetical protein [Candidatus Neomarinimicrobiota bacterium]MBL7110095.1 hypothetical protein [Candidatus Neomarinimicrobiota bacterium]